MRIVFIGTGEIGVPSLRILQESPEHEVVAVVTQPDKPAGRDQQMTAPPIKQAAGTAGVPILQPGRIKAPEAIAQLQSLHPDIIVVMAYGQILPRALLDIPRIACLNLHASLLPRWRGAAPIQAAIAAGDAKTGITVMYMDEGLDTGDVLLRHAIDITPSETGGSLHDRLGEIAPGALLEGLDLLAKGTASRIPQDNAAATHAPKLHRGSGKIDWSESAAAIERKIRAFNPWPGASTNVSAGGDKPRTLKIFAAKVVDADGMPGTILKNDEHDLVIATGDRALSLQEVQVEGKRRMKAAEFIRGSRGPLALQQSSG
jgi:methionyl-tRNA formyltransferase